MLISENYLGALSCSTAKLVCALLLKYWYHAKGYVEICFIVRGYSIR